MTTTPVMSITDEQIAEIERDIAAQSAIKHGQCEGGVIVRGEICRECGATPKDSCRRPLPKSYAVPSNILALISRLRAAEKDAKRYRFIRDKQTDPRFLSRKHEAKKWFTEFMVCEEVMDKAIDTAMEQSK